MAHDVSEAPPALDEAFLKEVLQGLGASPPTLPYKYFYDERGSALFEAITRLDAYYPTRTEAAILKAHAGEMAEALGDEVVLIEYGSGSSAKTRILLDALVGPSLKAYVPIDISREHLLASADALDAEYPGLDVLPVAADYTRPFSLPALPPEARRVVFFPGSTIGNFQPIEATAFLKGMAQVAGPGGGLLIGVDRPKSRAVLERAYDDKEGVTAQFNLNLLARLNRELGADFDLDAWSHRAVWNEAGSRVEMHLVSERDQTVRVSGKVFRFRNGDTIHTENSYKYAPGVLERLAAPVGWYPERSWSDVREWFTIALFRLGAAA